MLLIWGYIAFKVFDAVKENSELIPVYQGNLELTQTDSDSLNNYELKLDYPDPFLKRRSNVAAKINDPNSNRSDTKSTAQVTKTVKALPLRWPNINYKGTIANKKAAKALFMISIDGVNNFFHEGDERNDLKLLRAYKDSIRLEFIGKEKRTFLKQ